MKMEYYVSKTSVSNNTSELPAMSNGTNGTARGGGSESGEEGDGWIWDDATWILCASFIIFTMQTGKIIFTK